MKKGMNNGESFTEFYRQLNSRDGSASGIDVDIDGVYNRLGSRVNNESPLVKMWRALEGPLTEAEQSHLMSTPTGQSTGELMLTEDSLNAIRNNDLEGATRRSQSTMESAMSAMNENELYSHPATSNAISQHLSDAVHPYAMTTGLMGAFLGSSATKLIDPTGSFGRYDETGMMENQAVSGGITGVMSHVMNNGLAGSTALVSTGVGSVALTSAIGAVAAEGTRYGVEKGLEKVKANSDTKKSVSNLAGGAVGGATTVMAADAIAIGYATATGAELGATAGPMGALAGAGVGAVFGTLAYAAAKVNQIPEVNKAERAVSNAVQKVLKPRCVG
jgi:hypothetical protein